MSRRARLLGFLEFQAERRQLPPNDVLFAHRHYGHPRHGEVLAWQMERLHFRYRDYTHGRKQRKMTLAAEEFIRRFLLHVLPKGFVRIRHYGWLANRCRTEGVRLCRELLR